MNRVFFITTLTLWSMGKGHGGPAFTQTIQWYIKNGWEVFLISDEPSNGDYPELDNAHNIVIEKSPFYRMSKIRKVGKIFSFLDHWYTNKKFQQIMSSYLKANTSKTILYAYEIFGVSAAKRLAKQYKVPLVTRFQGTVLSGVNFQRMINRIRYHMHIAALSCPADCVIMTDDGTQGKRVLDALHNSSPICFWRNGLELMEHMIPPVKLAALRNAYRSQLGLKESTIVFLTVSRLVPWKHVERSIYGMKKVQEQGLSAKLMIVGDGSAKASLEQLVYEQQLQDYVFFTGAVKHDDVYGYMAAADVFISLYDLSNVGNPLLEAMTLGKCIVTLDVGDTNQLIEDRKNGILLEYSTLDRLGNVLLELANDPLARRQLGDEAAQYAREHFWTWSARMNAELEQVEQLLQ